MTEDELELDTMGDRKTALFLIMSDTDTTFVRPDRAPCNAEKMVLPRMITREAACLTERRKLTREHSTAGTR